MDSMRSLSGSLPRSSTRQSRQNQSSDFTQAFRSAALAVTQLYKTAAWTQEKSRAEGYQDALDELLLFLDHENMGLGDGEGWKVRQWATQRLSPPMDGTDSEGDPEVEERARSISPTTQLRSSPSKEESRHDETAFRNRADSAPLPGPDNKVELQEPVRKHSDMFHFGAHTPFAEDANMEAVTSDTNPTSDSTLSVSFDGLPRQTRLTARQQNNTRRRDRQPMTPNVQALGGGAGAKRKSAFVDFFEIGSLGSDKDSYGVGKKGRFL